MPRVVDRRRFARRLLDAKGNPIGTEEKPVRLFDADGTQFGVELAPKVLLDSSSRPLRPMVEIPTEPAVRELAAANRKSILASQNPVLREASDVLIQLGKLRPWQSEKAVELVRRTRLYKARAKQLGFLNQRAKVRFVARSKSGVVRPLDAAEIRRLFSDWVIDEYSAGKASRELLRRELEEHEEKLAGAARRIVRP